MSTRTLIEVNHDFIPEAIERLTELLKELGHASERDLQAKYNGIRGVRVYAQRHHSGQFYLRAIDGMLFRDCPSGVLRSEDKP